MATRSVAASLLVGFVLSCLAPGAARAESNTINAVIGDASWAATFGGDPDASAGETTRIRTHLAYVLEHLRTRDVTHLSPSAQHRRGAALVALERYLKRGVFPRRTDDPYAGRRPRFIDDLGTHCAVAQLIADSGAGELARSLDADYEYAYVREMNVPALLAWATTTGFTIDELAMIQPSYSEVPSAAGTRNELERAKDAITLECAREHAPMRQLSVRVIGAKSGRATVATKSTDPFARCFVTAASRVQTGGGAYMGSPETYQFDMDLRLPTPQQLFERAFDQNVPTDCTPRPGKSPRQATIEVTSDGRGLEVRVDTVPASSEVSACLESAVRSQLTTFAIGVWDLRLQRQQKLVSRMEPASFRQAVLSAATGHATDCYPAQHPPRRVNVSVSAQPDDAQFTIDIDTTDATFKTCLSDKLQRSLRDAFSVSRSVGEGSYERYFRIDIPVQTTASVTVESPAIRDERNRRLREEIEKDRYRF